MVNVPTPFVLGRRCLHRFDKSGGRLLLIIKKLGLGHWVIRFNYGKRIVRAYFAHAHKTTVLVGRRVTMAKRFENVNQ